MRNQSTVLSLLVAVAPFPQLSAIKNKINKIMENENDVEKKKELNQILEPLTHSENAARLHELLTPEFFDLVDNVFKNVYGDGKEKHAGAQSSLASQTYSTYTKQVVDEVHKHFNHVVSRNPEWDASKRMVAKSISARLHAWLTLQPHIDMLCARTRSMPLMTASLVRTWMTRLEMMKTAICEVSRLGVTFIRLASSHQTEKRLPDGVCQST